MLQEVFIAALFNYKLFISNLSHTIISCFNLCVHVSAIFNSI